MGFYMDLFILFHFITLICCGLFIIIIIYLLVKGIQYTNLSIFSHKSALLLMPLLLLFLYIVILLIVFYSFNRLKHTLQTSSNVKARSSVL